MSTIFISYSYADGADIARQLVAELEAAGSRCWMGPRDLKAGEDFPPQIVRAIRECRALVVLLTPKANGSRDVLQEVSLAHNAQKPLVPLIVRNTTPSDGLAYYLGILQQVAWADARTAAAAVRTVLTGLAPADRVGTGKPAASVGRLGAWLILMMLFDSLAGILSCWAGVEYIVHKPESEMVFPALFFGLLSLANAFSAKLIQKFLRGDTIAERAQLRQRIGATLLGMFIITLIRCPLIIQWVRADNPHWTHGLYLYLIVIPVLPLAEGLILALLLWPHWQAHGIPAGDSGGQRSSSTAGSRRQ